MRYLRQLLPRRRDLPSVGAAARRWGSMRWAALPITDRRWTAPLAAAALGMGLFVGVAIGPSAEQSTGAPAQFVAVPPELPAPPAAAPPPATPAPVLGGPVGNDTPPPPASSIPSPIPTPPPPVETAPLTPLTPLPPAMGDDGATTPLPAGESAPEPEPSDPSAEEGELVLAGTVVHVNPLARSYTLAGRGGRLSAIHAKRLPSAGARLKLPVRELRNGTFAADAKARKSGSRKQAELSGVVTFSDPGASRFTLSQRGVSALVSVPAEPGAPDVPKLGAQVTIKARIAPAPTPPPPPPVPEPPAPAPTTTTPAPAPGPVEPPAQRTASGVPPGCGAAPAQPKAPSSILEATAIEVTGESVAEGDFEGVVQGVCRERRRLILSADDLRASEADLTFAVASKAISLRRLRPGDVVSAVAAIRGANGALRLVAIARDRGIGEADDPKLAQGGGGAANSGAAVAEDDGTGGSAGDPAAERSGSPRR